MSGIEEDAATPWSSLGDVASIRVEPLGRPIMADMAVPGSKSLSNRALILAAMAEGRTRLTGLLKSDDTYWCSDALKRLGAGIDWTGMEAVIDGIGRRRPSWGRCMSDRAARWHASCRPSWSQAMPANGA